MSKYPDANYTLTSDVEASGTSDWGFDPIGNNTTAFNGTFDGNGYTISNLDVDESDTNNVGLFGVVGSSGTVTNVSLDSVSINGNDTVGAVVGENNGTVSNVSATGIVNGSDEVGGLVGKNNDTTAEVETSYSEVSVGASGDGVGGLVGVNENGSVLDTYAVGSVSGNASLGGLVGINNDSVGNSYWDGDNAGVSDSDGGTELTTSEMQGITAADNMGGLDFVSTWNTVSGDYPKFVWQTEVQGCSTTGVTDGSQPYDVSNIDELRCISEDLSAEYELTSDVEASGTADWNDGRGFAPIGDDSDRFTGTFDGNGYNITNLTIDRSSDFVGLFGAIGDSGEVKNLNLKQVDITGSGDVGGLAGDIGGTVTNVSVTGTVSGSGNNVGGIAGDSSGVVEESYSTSSVDSSGNEVGGVVGDNSYGWVNESYATGDVSGSVEVGGLVGYSGGGSGVYASYATGDVSGDKVGGLVGESTDSAIVEESYSVGSVSGTNTGGLVGAGSVIDNSYWDEGTSGLTTSAGGTGLSTEEMTDFDAVRNMNFSFGEVWRFNSSGGYPDLAWETEASAPECSEVTYDGEGTSQNPYKIGSTSYNAGDVYQLQCISEDLDGVYELTSDINASETADWYGGSGFNPIGGRLFRDNTPFSGSFDGNNNTIKGLTISRGEDFVGLFGVIEDGYVSNVSLMNPDVSGEERVGALVGENRGGSVTNVNVISGSLDGQRVGGVAGMNRGTVSNTSVTGSINSNGDRVGGLAASNRGTVSWSYSKASVDGENPNNAGGLVGHNFGLVTDSYATGSVSGGSYVGGLVGTMSSDAMVSGTYAAGNVTGNSNTGGLVGRSRGGSVMSSYWDNESTGQDTSEGGTGLTTSEMQGFDAAQSMTGLDFEGTWSAKNGSYPELRTASGTATPTASFAYSPEAPITSESIEFNASGSTDNGTIKSYGWSFGDGESGTGETVTHEYDEPGTYTVTLTVVNEDGATDTTTKDVEVTKPVEIESLSSVAPNGSLEINYAVREGSNHTVEVSPSGNATVNFTEYSGGADTNLGDGYDNSSENAEGVAVLNASESNGSFTATANVTNGTDGESLTVTVATLDSTGVELNTSSRDVNISDGVHPSGVSQNLFDGVAGEDGELEIGELGNAIDKYQANETISGEKITLGDVGDLVDWYSENS